MNKTITFFALFFSFLCTAAQSQTTAKPAAKSAASPKSNALTNKSIIDLQKAGLGDEIILTKIAQSKCVFDLSTEGLIDLKSKGVSADVIKAMMNKSDSEASAGSSTTTTGVTKAQPKSNGAGNTNAIVHAVELVNYVYVLHKGDQSVKPLEKSMAGKRTRSNGFKGFLVLQVDGANSGVSLPADDIQYFLVNTGGALPEINLYILKSAKGRREVESMSAGGLFDNGKSGGEKHQVSVNISKLDNNVYKITLDKTLEKGEYFFTTKPEATATSFDVYTFGVK